MSAPAIAITERAAPPRSGDLDLAPGTRIQQYELIRELGRGGMGVVYAARDVKLGRRVAIKFLRRTSREVLERFLVEARATARCSHENIVIIHAVDEHADMPYMVLEYLEGMTLRDLLGEFGAGTRLPPSRVVEIALPIARALERAHALDIVHRDLKPENVFVTRGGQVKVLDFGIAKAHAPARRAGTAPPVRDLTATGEGALIGTLPYMAPEQLSNTVDHRTDLWALGVVMFEMLTGRHPVEPLTTEALFQHLADDTPVRSVRALAPEVPEVLAGLVASCLQKDRSLRARGAGAIAARLEAMLPRRAGHALAEHESPYPGLVAFQEADAERYFGRASEVTRMVARIRDLPLTGVVGPSGAGKSSFVRAGVGPALKGSGESWEVIAVRPGRHPIHALADVVHRAARASGEQLAAGHAGTVRRLRGEPGFLGAVLRDRARALGTNLLLFVDQLEELYTLVADAGERAAFTAALAGVADDGAAPLRVVISMRSDFLDRIAEDPRFAEELTRGLVLLAPPSRDALRDALVQPLELAGYRFETSAMVDEVLDALAETPNALPLLQFVASRLWEARDRGDRRITEAAYHAIGGISGALAAHADDVIARLDPAARAVARHVFRKLVTPERTRAIVELADLLELGERTRGVVDQLVAARLLVVQTRADGGSSVEIVHESLIDRWPALRRWLDEEHDDAVYLAQLSGAAKQWDQRGRSPGLVWRGDAALEAERWYHHRPRELPAREQAFLAAAFALARRGRRMRRFGLIAAFAVLALVAAGAGIASVRIGRERDAAARALEDRLAAEAAAEAEQARARAATAAAAQAEVRKRAAEDEARDAEQAKAAAEGAVELSRQELIRKNAELERAAADAKLARDRADRERQGAIAARNDAEAARAQLERKLEAEAKKVRELEKERARLMTKLPE